MALCLWLNIEDTNPFVIGEGKRRELAVRLVKPQPNQTR